MNTKEETREHSWGLDLHFQMVSFFRFYSIEKSTYFHCLKKKKSKYDEKPFPHNVYSSDLHCDSIISEHPSEGSRVDGVESERGGRRRYFFRNRNSQLYGLVITVPCKRAQGHTKMTEHFGGHTFLVAMVFFICHP